MNKNIYFSILIKDASGVQKGFAVCIPPETNQLPGDRIKGLTEAARTLPLTDGERLRTEMLVAPPADMDMRPLTNYLWGDGTLNSPRLVRHLDDYRRGRVPHKFLPRVGMTVVMEEEFIGREPVMTLLEELVAKNRSCHLRAPRRYGKSSLMGRMFAKLGHAVMLELSDIGTLPGFLKMLLRACMRHETARSFLYELPAYRSWPFVSDHASFSQVFNRAFSELMKRYAGNKIIPLLSDTLTALADNGILLLIDEFSLFLHEMCDNKNNEAELRDFLELFHQLRTRTPHPLVAVFAGSAGLSTYIELYDMHDLFADLIPVDVPPISAIEARLLAEELFYGMEKLPTVAAIDRLVALTGNDETVPYFVQALASYTAEQAGRKREISADDVELAYYDRLLGPAGNVCFRDFILRERSYPGDYRKCASPILKKLSQATDVVAEEDLQMLCKGGCDFKKLMTCLEEDYDLVHENNNWRMRSKVIADRWRLGEPWLTVGGN